MNIDNSGPAFPLGDSSIDLENSNLSGANGITRREYIAALAVQADAATRAEGLHAAIDSASELATNAPDDRYRRRAEQVLRFLRAMLAQQPAALAVPAIPKALRDEWRSERGNGMTSAVGEYTPREFWDLLDAYEALLAQQPAAAVPDRERVSEAIGDVIRRRVEGGFIPGGTFDACADAAIKAMGGGE